MQIPDEIMEHIDGAKSEWLESQFRTRLEFVIASRDRLVTEAHTTLNWLFAIIVIPAGYSLNHINENRPTEFDFYVAVIASIVAGVAAIILFMRCLRFDSMIGLGNCPSNLLNKDFCKHALHDMQLAESANFEERIAQTVEICSRLGSTITIARWSIVLIPIVSIFAAGLISFFRR